MPSQTFDNLSNDKKERILTSALKEFGRVSYEEASINQIIKNADISRGSFYMYFKDKEDLYIYILSNKRKMLEKKLVDLIIKNNGDFILAWEQFYLDIIAFCTKKENYKFFKNLFVGMRFTTEKHFAFKPSKLEMEEYKKKIISIIDRSKFNVKNDNDLFDSYMFLQMTTLSSIAFLFLNEDFKNKSVFENRINIIKNGLYERKEI
ncbi:MAG: TetR/AcrR family transcriptional regulator [Bacilli bacterium]|nr:TetR/AcrR family transcriptional regulator [Bacilli bacterium]